MLLTLAFNYRQIKWIIPSVYAASILPTYFFYWFLVRFVTLPLNKRYYHTLDNFLFELFSRQFIYFALKSLPGKVYFYGDMSFLPRRNDSSIAIANYQTKFDWLIMAAVANKQNSLGKFRSVINKNIRNIPFVGLVFKLRQYIFDSGHKNKERDFTKILHQMRKIDYPVWFFIFPEEKRFSHKSPQIISMNKKFSIEHQLPVFKHVLLPKIDVTYAALCSFIDRLDNFCDFTIAYTESTGGSDNRFSIKTPSINQIFVNKSIEIHILMRHFSKEKLMKSLHATDIRDLSQRDKVVQFLIEIFHQKDVNLENFILNSPDYLETQKQESTLQLFNLQLGGILPGLVFFTASNLAFIYLNTTSFRKVLVQAYLIGALLSCLRI